MKLNRWPFLEIFLSKWLSAKGYQCNSNNSPTRTSEEDIVQSSLLGFNPACL